MPNVFPATSDGGVIVRDTAGSVVNTPGANTPGVYRPGVDFTMTCNQTAFNDGTCPAIPSEEWFNAVQGDLLALAEALNPNGIWDCNAVGNIAANFAAWRDGNYDNSLRDIIAEMLAAIDDVFLDTVTYAPTTGILTLTLTNGAVFTVTIPTVSGDANNILTAGTDGGAYLSSCDVFDGPVADPRPDVNAGLRIVGVDIVSGDCDDVKFEIATYAADLEVAGTGGEPSPQKIMTVDTIAPVVRFDDTNRVTGVGLSAASGATGADVEAFGRGAAVSDLGDNVNAYGRDAAGNNSGDQVEAYGRAAAFNNSGDLVSAYGWRAAFGNTGNSVTAVGRGAAEANTGNNVTAIGADAAHDNTGSEVVAVGGRAAFSNTGSNVSAVGVQAAENNTGTDVAAFGPFSGLNNTGGLLDAFGTNSAGDNTGSEVIAIGRDAAGSNTGDFVEAHGRAAAELNTADNVNAYGWRAARSNAGVEVDAYGQFAAEFNTAGGVAAYGPFAAQNNTGATVEAFGRRAAQNNTGAQITAVGRDAAQDNTGDFVEAHGRTAAQNNTGDQVDAFGWRAAIGNTGNEVDAYGWRAAEFNTGSQVDAIGNLAARLNTGSNVVAVGRGSAASNTGQRVTAVGTSAAPVNTASDVTALGRFAGNGAGFANTTLLGHSSIATAANQAVVGNPTQTPVGYAPFVSISDQRDKIVEPSHDIGNRGLEFIEALEPVAFRFDHRSRYVDEVVEFVEIDGIPQETTTRTSVPRDGSRADKRIRFGFLAQQVQAAAVSLKIDFHGVRDMATEGGEDVLMLEETALIPDLVLAIKELSDIVKKQAKEIAALKKSAKA